ncbi:MAG: GAF domain-containing sensor histidine kinase [Nostocaceae cyanobacterium]|nr:GAF domain-containing sensor histidine kinase [Nostocaceae cyanobacterium]
MKKSLSSSSKFSVDEVERHTQNAVKLMQHQEQAIQQLSHKINHIIANHPANAKMLQEIAQVLGVAFEVDSCCLVTVDTEPSGKAITASWLSQDYLGVPQPDEILSMQQMDSPKLQCASEALTIEDISVIENSLVVGCQHLPLPIKAVLALPTRFGGKNNGVITLIKADPYDWSESEKQLLKALESVCAIAFSQVIQTQLMAVQQQFLDTSAKHQNLMKQLTILTRSNLELNQMLQLAIASTGEALEADRGMLILLKYSDPLFKIRAKKRVPKAKATVVGEWFRSGVETFSSTEQAKDNSFWLSECGLCQRAFAESGKPVIISDNSQRRRDTSNIAPVFILDQLSASLIVQLESQGKVLGFLVLQQKTPRSWQPTELSIVEMVCAQLTNTIIQSQTLRQVQNLVDERTGQLQRSLEVQAKLYEIKQQHVKQLQELNHLKDEFLSNISDRLRYPLTNMRMALRNLRHPEITPERQTRYLDILEQECTKEINLINDLLTLQRLESDQKPPQFETINLNTKIKDLLASFETQMLQKGLSISLDLPQEPLTLQTEVESFDRILQELLTNVSKYSQDETLVDLQVIHHVDQLVDRVTIKVTNIGRSISEEEATYIFDKFRRGKGRWTPGTGLGLALVKSLVQHLNGEIAVESIPIADEENDLSKICFTLTLPQFSEHSNSYSDSD